MARKSQAYASMGGPNKKRHPAVRDMEHEAPSGGNTGGAVRPARINKTAQRARRRQVMTLYLMHWTQERIAEHLQIATGTVCQDIQALMKEWQRELMMKVGDWVVRELADLDQMETEAIDGYEATQELGYLQHRLKIKERRAKLLGLDADSRREVGGGGSPFPALTEVIVHLPMLSSGGNPPGVGGGGERQEEEASGGVVVEGEIVPAEPETVVAEGRLEVLQTEVGSETRKADGGLEVVWE